MYKLPIILSYISIYAWFQLFINKKGNTVFSVFPKFFSLAVICRVPQL